MTVEQIVRLLHMDVVPALGCTEPVCVALSAAHAAKLLGHEVMSVDVEVNPGIYKNGMSAGIPNCSYVGLDRAASLGSFLMNPEKELTLLEDITPEILEKADRLVREERVHVHVAENMKSLYVRCTAASGSESAECVIRNAHTNVVKLTKNNSIVYEQEESSKGDSSAAYVDALVQMKISEIRDLVDAIPAEDLKFMLDGVAMNEELAAYSEKADVGVGIAEAFRREMEPSGVLSGGLMERIIYKVSSAAESRLDGCPLPTMSSSGAGTKGLVVILPVSETANALGVSEEKKVRAIALAHLVNRYINAHIGKLSPMCSCVMSSSTAAAVGMTYLFGGTNEQITYAIRNMTGTVTGMICDGGKVGCAMKVASGSVSALMSAVTAVQNAPLRVSDGICAESAEDCIRNMARIGNVGMMNTDREIIRIMNEK